LRIEEQETRLTLQEHDDDDDGYSGSGMGVMDWIDLAQDRDRWREPVKAVINLQVP
jgi:hypothetical protein